MYTLTLQRTEEVANGTRLFVFDRPADFEFHAGQYIALKVNALPEPDPRGPVRSLSIASHPGNREEVHFAMRKTESAFKKAMWALSPGDTVQVTKAIGFFTFPQDDRPIVFLAGGIGITPVRSMLLEAAMPGPDRKLYLFYSNREAKDAAFEDELKVLPIENYTYVRTLTQCDMPSIGPGDERGYIRREIVEKYIPKEEKPYYFLVGTPQFIEAMESMLNEMGVPEGDRKKDSFTGLTPNSAVQK